MKINVQLPQPPPKWAEVEIQPDVAIAALRQEITARINAELVSLKLPESELKIPHGGFDVFYLNEDSQLRAYHEDGRHHRNIETDVEIRWGVDQFTSMVKWHVLLEDMRLSGVFR